MFPTRDLHFRDLPFLHVVSVCVRRSCNISSVWVITLVTLRGSNVDTANASKQLVWAKLRQTDRHNTEHHTELPVIFCYDFYTDAPYSLLCLACFLGYGKVESRLWPLACTELLTRLNVYFYGVNLYRMFGHQQPFWSPSLYSRSWVFSPRPEMNTFSSSNCRNVLFMVWPHYINGQPYSCSLTFMKLYMY